MRYLQLCLALSVATASLSSCTLILPTGSEVQNTSRSSNRSPAAEASATTEPQPEASPESPVTELSGFYFQLQELFSVQGFSTQALDSTQENLLQEVVSDFVSDMENGNTDDYYNQPNFSIQLFAGSEGGYFQSPDILAAFTNSVATYAQALVVYPDQSYDVFKGQYSDQKFYFSGADTLPEDNTTYLITLDSDLQPQVFSGNLVPFSVASDSGDAEVSPSPTPTPEPTPSSTSTPYQRPVLNLFNADNPPPPPEQRFAPALEAAQRRGADYRRQVKNARFLPPPPPPPDAQGKYPPLPPPPNGAPAQVGPAYPTPEMVAHIRAQDPELAKEFEALMGLPPEEHTRRAWELYDAHPDLIPVPPMPRPPAEKN